MSCVPGFRAIYPGMSSGQVAEAMGNGPTQVTPYENGYSSWFFNDDRCVLLKDNVVVSKATSHNQGGVHVAGIGGISFKQPAQCLPPGMQADPTTTINVGLPRVNVNVR